MGVVFEPLREAFWSTQEVSGRSPCLDVSWVGLGLGWGCVVFESSGVQLERLGFRV